MRSLSSFVSAMQSAAFLDKDMVKNPQFTPNAHQMSGPRGKGKIKVIAFILDLITSK